MHRLRRSVRFSVNPFLDEDEVGANAFASRPSGTGLAVFFELAVEVVGRIESETGFVRNVVDIDAAVRQCVVPVFAAAVREHWRRGRHIDFSVLAGLLGRAWRLLDCCWAAVRVAQLRLQLNPYRSLAIDSEVAEMVYFSEKFEFAAMHKLWNDKLSAQRNIEVFGKCANPSGHGHNYTLEVTVKAPDGGAGLDVGRFEQIVDERVVAVLDHKNLNADVDYFAAVIPSIENLAVFAWDRLKGCLGQMELHCITVWETDRTCCSYYGP